MKKIFHLKTEKKHPDRVLESVKYEVRRYLKRERKKPLPEKATFWDFDCAFGQNSEETQKLSASELITALDRAKDDGWEQCYVEIIAKAIHKKSTTKDEADEEEADAEEPVSSAKEDE